MTLQEMEKMDKKSKFKKLFTRIAVGVSVAFNLLFVGILAVGCANVKKSNNAQQKGAYHQNDSAYVYRKDKMNVEYQPRFATYDDDSKEITLTADELNNYTWQNLANYLTNNRASLMDDHINLSTIQYNSVVYQYSDWDYNTNEPYIDFGSLSETNIYINLYGSYKWEQDSTFSASLTWFLSHLTNEQYSDLKQAIQLDVQSSSSSDDDFTQDIFGAITDSLGGFVNTLNSGITSMVSVFYDSTNHNLTTIGLLSVIFVSVALAYWLFRLIIGLIRMRG